MPFDLTAGSLSSWELVSRLGEAQILLPAAALAGTWMAWRLAMDKIASVWLLGVTVAAFLTTASKVAFIGWGQGWAQADFTGVSGHAMFAAAIYPVLALAVTLSARQRVRHLAIVLGAALALLIAVSRVQVQAHSVSEVIAGWLLGTLASALALTRGSAPLRPPRRWVPVLLMTWLTALPWLAPPSITHELVTQLSLTLSKRTRPYQREDLHQHLPVPLDPGANHSFIPV